MEEIIKMVEKEIEGYKEMGLNKENIHVLYELADIRKDLKEVEEMRYERGYGNYGEDGNYGRRRRDSRGRFMEGGYGRRGNYRGNDEMEMLDRMGEGYSAYREGMEEYGRGNYSGKEEGLESLEYMLESFVQFYEYLMKNADTQEEVELIKKYAKKIKEM